eukprot:1685482-Lingulodinium_polyedra.AAC.1
MRHGVPLAVWVLDPRAAPGADLRAPAVARDVAAEIAAGRVRAVFASPPAPRSHARAIAPWPRGPGGPGRLGPALRPWRGPRA